MKFTNVVIASCIILAHMAVGAGVPVGSVARGNEATAYVPLPLPSLLLLNSKYLSKGITQSTGPIAGMVPTPTAAGRGVVQQRVSSGVGLISPSLASPM